MGMIERTIQYPHKAGGGVAHVECQDGDSAHTDSLYVHCILAYLLRIRAGESLVWANSGSRVQDTL
jgi:hypothetical protein